MSGSAGTPEQAAYEAWRAVKAAHGIGKPEWEATAPLEREAMKAAAQAAVAAFCRVAPPQLVDALDAIRDGNPVTAAAAAQPVITVTTGSTSLYGRLAEEAAAAQTARPVPARKVAIALAALQEISGYEDADASHRARQAFEDIVDVREAAAQPEAGDDLRPALESLARFWITEYVTSDGWPDICAKQLLDVLGGAREPVNAAAAAQPASDFTEWMAEKYPDGRQFGRIDMCAAYMAGAFAAAMADDDEQPARQP